MEWVTNTPKRDLWQPSLTDIELHGSRRKAERAYDEWCSRFVEGEPQATAAYEVQELKRFGMVGLYRKHDEADPGTEEQCREGWPVDPDA